MINSLLPMSGDVSIYRDCCIAIKDKNPPPKVVLDVAKCCLNNAKQTCKAILKGRISKLDPIVGENACQIRALVAITSYLDLDLRDQLISLKGMVEILLGNLSQLNLNNLKGELALKINSLGLNVSVSEKVDYLLRSHFLTVGKYFDVKPGGEISGIREENIRVNLKNNFSNNKIQMLIKEAQEKISEDSVRIIQTEAVKLKDDFLIVQMKMFRLIKPEGTNKKLYSSCAFYNLKVVMLRACEMRIPILIKEHGKINPKGMYFCPNELEILNEEQPILVIECFFSDICDEKEILKHGLMNLVLANVACTDQYSAHDDISLLEQEAQEEILKYRTLGKELGCQTASPAIFSIAHIHAATVKEEKVV